MERPTNLKDANEIIEKLLDKLAVYKINNAHNQVSTGCCPYQILGNPMKLKEDEECNGKCRTCKEEFWEAYETMIYDKYKLEE